jgi:D-alanyl-D-alanine carboxypeptidase (penicillin-binding protein 5/6)
MTSIIHRAVCATAAVALACTPLSSASADDNPPGPVGGPRMAETGLIADPADGALPQITAPSWLIADASSGQVLAALDPHHRRRPASTQKTLLALTMAPRLDPGGSYTADVADTRVDGTRVGLVAGQTYSLTDLWYGLFLRSGNDAANAIAKAGADGDVSLAVRMEQAEAQRLQALDTTVVNPSGLDADGQYSSAYDLALWGRAALGRGDLRRYYTTLRHQFPGDQTQTGTTQTSKPFWLYTQNRLINKYDGAIGVKAGYTTLAHNTLIAAATRNGRTILVTLMGAQANVFDQAKVLLDWGFAHPQATPVGQLVDPVSPAVISPVDAAPPVGATPSSMLAAAPVAVTVSPATSDKQTLGIAAAAGAGCGTLLVLGRARRRRAARRGNT